MTLNVRTLVLASAAFALASFTASLQAQSQVRVDVPFAFQNGSQVLPAGVYTLGSLSRSIITIHGHGNSGLIMSRTEATVSAPAHGKVVFQQYGDKYFLHEVWQANNPTHVVCIQTREEAKAQKNARASQLASTAVPAGQPVQVEALEASR